VDGAGGYRRVENVGPLGFVATPMPPPSVVRFRPKAGEVERLDALAAAWHTTRSGAIHRLIDEANPAQRPPPLTEADLVSLLEDAARRGNMQAVRLLLERPWQRDRPAIPERRSVIHDLAERRRRP
jgi:hypothetical protein